jgi:integrase
LRIGDAVALSTDKIVDGAIFLRTAKTGSPVRCPIPKTLQYRLGNIRRINERFLFFSGECQIKSAVADWQRTLARLFKLAQIKDAFAHRFRDTFATDLLSNGIALEDVSVLLGHADTKITWKHYAPWIQARQDRLEEAVRRTFNV